MLPFCVAPIEPLLVNEPLAFRVKTVPAALLELGAIVAPAATVKSPCTAIVTFAVESALETAAAVLALTVMESGSKNQLPTLPIAAVTLITALAAISKTPTELVSIKPPLPPNAPPIALSVPATDVFTFDQILI